MAMQGHVSLQKSIAAQAEHGGGVTRTDDCPVVGSGSVVVQQHLRRSSSAASGNGCFSFFFHPPEALPSPHGSNALHLFTVLKYSLSERFFFPRSVSETFSRRRLLMFRTSAHPLGRRGIWRDLGGVKYLRLFWTAIRRTARRPGGDLTNAQVPLF